MAGFFRRLFGRKEPAAGDAQEAPEPTGAGPASRPSPATPREVVGPDGFPHPAGEVGALHATISSLLEELLANERLEFAERRLARHRPAWTALGERPRGEQRDVVLALVERLEWAREQPHVEGERDDPLASRLRTARWKLHGLLEDLLRRAHPFSASDVERIVELCLEQRWYHGPWLAVLSTVEHLTGPSGLTARLRAQLSQARDAFARYEDRDHRELVRRIDDLLGGGASLDLTATEPWSVLALADLAAMDPAQRDRWAALLTHAATASAPKPAAKWLAAAKPLAQAVGATELAARLGPWFEAVDTPRTPPGGGEPLPNFDPWALRLPHEDMLRGLAWVAGLEASAPLARALGRLALAGLRTRPGVGPTRVRLTNAAIHALGAMPSQDALGQLAVLKVKVRHRPTLKQIDKALAAAATRLGVTADEIDELGVPTYGMEEVGVLRRTLGDVTAEVHVTGTNTTEIRWRRADGKASKSPPASVKTEHAAGLAELKAVAKDLQKIVPAQRDRIDRLALARRTWPLAAWRERYLNHPVVGTVARRLIWRLRPADGATGEARSALWWNGALVDADDRPLPPLPPETVVELWHPLVAGAEEVARWRAWLDRHEVTQPFKQAHREVYPLTPAEQATRTYSNRFAAHVVRQHQFHALCQARGWQDQLRLMVDDDAYPPGIELPAWGLRAEFWVEGIGTTYREDTTDTGTYLRLATDQVRFYRSGAARSRGHASGGAIASQAEPVPLEEVPPLVFSEVMRDVDLFVGVASVGNDPTWVDGGPGGRAVDAWSRFAFGELGESAKTRKEVLEKLVPRLAIAERCRFEGRYLVVRGDRRTYKIHLGSGNILMEPNDTYLCIVPDRSAAAERIHLPFEGDATLALILSKAFLLAHDAAIRDETILRQIARTP